MATEGEWWQAIRRSFGIPDIVSDDHARDVIAERITPTVAAEEHRALAKRIIEAIEAVGVDGGLDGYLIPTANADADRAIDAIKDKMPPVWSDPRSDWSLKEPMIVPLLEQLRSWVSEHPYDSLPGVVVLEPDAGASEGSA